MRGPPTDNPRRPSVSNLGQLGGVEVLELPALRGGVLVTAADEDLPALGAAVQTPPAARVHQPLVLLGGSNSEIPGGDSGGRRRIVRFPSKQLYLRSR